MTQSAVLNFRIAAYRGFHNVPRTILAIDECGRGWIFDSVFDDAVDDYNERYQVYPPGAGDEVDMAARLDQHCRNISLKSLGDIRVDEVAFDNTKRKSFSSTLSGDFS